MKNAKTLLLMQLMLVMSMGVKAQETPKWSGVARGKGASGSSGCS